MSASMRHQEHQWQVETAGARDRARLEWMVKYEARCRRDVSSGLYWVAVPQVRRTKHATVIMSDWVGPEHADWRQAIDAAVRLCPLSEGGRL